MIKLFGKMVNFVLIFLKVGIYQSLTFFAKCSVLDVCQGSEYASESCSLFQGLKIGEHYLKKPSLPSTLLKKDSTVIVVRTFLVL